MGKTIILNRIYTGDYLDEGANLGHEVINLFRQDNDGNDDPYYVYLMSDGTYPSSQSKEIEAIYFTKAINSNCVEVLSVATGITPVFEPVDGFRCLSGGEDELKYQFNDLLSRPNLEKISNALEMPLLRENIKWLDKSEFSEQKKKISDHQELYDQFKKLQEITKELKKRSKNTVQVDNKEIQKLKKAIARRALHIYQLYYIANKKVCYGGIRVDQLFKENTSEQYGLAIFLTYKAQNIRKPNKKLYIITDDKYMVNASSENTQYIKIKRDRLATTKLATYFEEDGKTTKTDKIALNEQGEKIKIYNEEKKKYETKRVPLEEDEKKQIIAAEKKNFKLLKALSTSNIFKDGTSLKKYEPIKFTGENFTFLSLIKKEYDELVFSNMFHFFFSHEAYRTLFIDFIDEYTKGKIKLSRDFMIGREVNNIDLLITDSQNAIVIENKVKSAINGLKYDENGELIEDQLDKYRRYVEQNYAERNKYFFVFLPDYSVINEHELKGYTPIYYSVLADWFKKGTEFSTEKKLAVYYSDFIQALIRHSTSTDNPHEEIMRMRLQESIDRVKKEQTQLAQNIMPSKIQQS